METPNTKAGKTTEMIMASVRAKLPDITTHQYNRTYEAVMEILTMVMPESGDVVRYPHGGGMFIHRSKQ